MIALYRFAAANGSAEAQYWLGHTELDDRELGVTPEEVHSLLRSAAEQNHPGVHHALAKLSDDMAGERQKYMTQAAALLSEIAMIELADLPDKNLRPETTNWITSYHGNSRRLFDLGYQCMEAKLARGDLESLYLLGDYLILRDDSCLNMLGNACLKFAAYFGHHQALDYWGSRYYDGVRGGVKKDRHTAFICYKASLERGNSNGAKMAGLLCLKLNVLDEPLAFVIKSLVHHVVHKHFYAAQRMWLLLDRHPALKNSVPPEFTIEYLEKLMKEVGEMRGNITLTRIS
jgi:TPR repeat protein